MPEDYAREPEISIEWTDLSFELDNLGLKALAKKCRVKGWYWETQGRFDSAFLAKAQVSFAEVENAARRLLSDIYT
jgi:hypothetical protein